MKKITRKVEIIHSAEYKCGFSHAQCAFHRHSTACLTPSMNEREEFGYAWREFMAGWNAGMKAISKE